LIERYSIKNENPYGDEIPDDWLRMEQNPEGCYVKYEDHVEIVKRLEDEINLQRKD
jgi:hypothetical protein